MPPSHSPVPHATVPACCLVVPTLNEEHYIAGCLASLIAQAEAVGAELFVVDGGSTDRTRPIVREIAAVHACVRLLDNPRRLQSAAVNLAARASNAPVLIRADAHACYPPQFVAALLASMAAHAASSVVVPMVTAGKAGFGCAVAAAQNSRLGNGGSAHRRGTESGWVEHGHHAAFDRGFFLRLGGYDEAFSHNEDAEFDRRAILAGGRIWMCAQAAVTYFPRADLASLARQYRRHGSGRAMMLAKHRLRPRLRQMLPVVALAGVVGSILLGLVQPLFWLLPVLYVGGCLAAGAVIGLRAGDGWIALSGVAAVTMHMAWAWGFVRSVAQGWWAGRHTPRPVVAA